MPRTTEPDKTQFPQADSSAYQQLVVDARDRVQTGRLAAYRAVNKELIQMYWDLGKMILERQEENGWGNSVVEMLAKDLQKTFPKMEGLSKTNLWRMRAFYRAMIKSNFSHRWWEKLVGRTIT
jgi:predicted nuclease of restriction endonuclease-like (RecB) superfamily